MLDYVAAGIVSTIINIIGTALLKRLRRKDTNLPMNVKDALTTLFKSISLAPIAVTLQAPLEGPDSDQPEPHDPHRVSSPPSGSHR